MAIFKSNKEGQIVLHKDALSLCPDLKTLQEKNLKYIILVYDYVDSPYKQKPLEERKKMAMKNLFNGQDYLIEMESWFTKAKDDYCSLIYDAKRAIIDAINTKLNILNLRISSPNITSEKELKSLSVSIELLLKQKEKLESEVQMEDDIYEAKGGRQLSYLEKIKLNRELYKIQKKEESFIKATVIPEEQNDDNDSNF
jgi:hypothetical protein